MEENQTFEIRLNPELTARINETAKKIYIQPTELLLYFLLCGIKDHEIGARLLPMYRKILEKLKKDLDYEQKTPEVNGN